MRQLKPKLYEKLEEAFKAVLPVVGIVLLLCFGVAPVPSIPNMTLILSVAVGIFLVVALVRILFGIALAPMLLVLYAGASGLAFLVSGDFLAVAVDSGGVASGPMTAAFLLPFAMGACQAVGDNLVRDAFGVVAMVAMTSLVTIQALEVFYQLQTRRTLAGAGIARTDSGLETFGDYDIIEL